MINGENWVDNVIGPKYLRESMLDGLALHKMLFDQKGNAIDYVYVEVNRTFEDITGMKREKIIGKKVTEIFPDIKHDHFNWIEKYGEVTRYKKTIVFEQHSLALNKWFKVSAFSPLDHYFVTIFKEIPNHSALTC